jgi:flagellar biogenesis protein FliO
MFDIGTDTSQSGAPSKSLLQNWPLAILFAGLGLNVAWIVGLAWLVVKLAVRLFAG